MTIINVDGNNDLKFPDLNKLTAAFEERTEDMDATNLLNVLHSTTEGITWRSIDTRKRAYGTNALPPPIMKSFLQFLLIAMKDRMVVFLLFAAFVTVGVGIYETATGEPNAWLEGATIVIAIAIITGVNAVNDFRKQARFRKLNDANVALRTVKVVREGKSIQLPPDELVVGDIMEISMGDVLPCDAILVEGNSVKTDESGITGETKQIDKTGLHDDNNGGDDDDNNNNDDDTTKDPYLISGTTVVDGNGKALVLVVGIHSTQGKTMMDLRIDPPPTPLQTKLSGLAKRLATVGLVVAAITLSALLIIFFVKRATANTSESVVDGLISVLLVGISIIVMAIPEGLPLAVALSLAHATIHMLKDRNLVRHLVACETMGGATTVCSDKTGTLTVNKMSVVEAVVFANLHYRHRAPDEIGMERNLKSCPVWKEFAFGICVNTEAYEALVGNATRFLGSQTEVALIEWIGRIDGDVDYRETRKNAHVVRKSPFNSRKKYSSVTTAATAAAGNLRTHVKGAPEIILPICDRFVDECGVVHAFDDDARQKVYDMVEKFAEKCLRTLCCAYRDGDDGNDGNRKNNGGDDGSYHRDYVLYATFGLEDPLRNNAKQSVQDCQRAGIVVRMVTGDNVVTARSIARQCGIVRDGKDVIIEGVELRRLIQSNDRSSLDKLLPNLRVMARSSPNDKLLLVNALQNMGETVAVTGDGANDAPALKNSDVGFSMGLSGTEVAKEASDIVLLDDNFASIVRAILWGRAIYSGIQRFITFQLSVNISAVFITVVTSIEATIASGRPVGGLTTLQILLLNLVADTLAAMALSTDRPVDALLDKKPHRRTDHIITGNMWRMILAQSLYQIVVGLLVYYVGPLLHGGDQALRGSILFNTFVYMVLFNELNCRSIDTDFNVFRGITKNKFFIPLFVVGFVVQFPIVTYLGIIFDTVPIPFAWWVISIALGSGSIFIGMLVRLVDLRFQ